MDISTLYKCFTECSGVTTDSRNCPEGSMFIALKGETFNGNAFAAQALEKGCRYAVVDEEQYAGENPHILLVDNCLRTLQELANFHRRTLDTRIIGITGTNGKTTTKELIAAVLQKKYRILYTLGNLNNHIGVPLTLLRLTPDDELAVIEMGANHPGEIKTLSAIVEPDYGIITNVGKAHLEGFGSFEGVIKTKGELYEHLRYGGEHTIFIDRDNEHLNKISKGLTCITYGTEDEAELYVSGKAGICAPFLTFEWRHEDRRHKVSTHLIGSYNLKNALAAIAIGRFFNVSEEDISKALEEYIPHNNRSQLTPTADNNLIVDAYNANPTSMKAAIENLSNIDADKKVLLLGAMKELGENSVKEHQDLVELIKQYNWLNVVLVGGDFEKTTHPFYYFSNTGEARKWLEQQHFEDTYFLLKGSRGIAMENVLA